MEVLTALSLYVLTVSVVCIALFATMKIHVWSALCVALLVGLIVVLYSYPPTHLCFDEEDSQALLIVYISIIVFTPIILLFYIFSKAFFDFRHLGPSTSLP